LTCDMSQVYLQDIYPIIPVSVRRVCASLRSYPDQTEVARFTQRIAFLLWENDYRVLRSFNHAALAETWLFTIAKRHISTWLRERDRVSSLDEIPPDSLVVPQDQEDVLLSKEREAIVEAAIGRLTEQAQLLLQLRRQGRTVEEIAQITGIKRRSVSREMNALIKKLRSMVNEGNGCACYIMKNPRWQSSLTCNNGREVKYI
jgi:RNA polymerase sigma factor (sigma-70 family)